MPVRIADCRYELSDPAAGRARYLAGHIPTAAFLDLEQDLSDMSVPAVQGGRHPLPARERFAAAMQRAGIGDGDVVVAYDDGGRGGAERLWWLLRHYGHDECGVLAGGIAAWLGPLRAGAEPAPAPATFTARPRADDVITTDELVDRLRDPALVLVDARAAPRYRGEVEPLDPVAGHIPGAVNVPFNAPAALPAEVLQAPELAVYCGSGVTACVVLAALHRAGRDDARLYADSFSAWSRRALPVEQT